MQVTILGDNCLLLDSDQIKSETSKTLAVSANKNVQNAEDIVVSFVKTLGDDMIIMLVIIIKKIIILTTIT